MYHTWRYAPKGGMKCRLQSSGHASLGELPPQSSGILDTLGFQTHSIFFPSFFLGVFTELHAYADQIPEEQWSVDFAATLSMGSHCQEPCCTLKANRSLMADVSVGCVKHKSYSHSTVLIFLKFL